MKNVSIILAISALVFIALLSSCTKKDGGEGQLTKTEQAAGEYYTCPMHPSVISDKPGACPVCGMALVKKTRGQTASSAELANLEDVSLSPTQRVMANVATTRVGRGSSGPELQAVGVVDFAEPLESKVTARFTGRIEHLYVNYTGQQVRKGDPLFDLYSPELFSAIQELQLAVRADGDEAGDSQQQLLQASRERLQSRFGMTADQVRKLESATQSKQTVTFYSPISGTVIGKQVEAGQYVNEGTLLYDLADLSRVWVYLDLYEQNVSDVKTGQPVRVTAEAYPQETFRGKVTFIDPVVNPETRTVRVRAELMNPGGKLKPKMFVSAQIEAGENHASHGGGPLTVPATAVLYTGKRTIVWVESKENMFEPRDVAVGATLGGNVEILSGLRDGETVVTSGNYLLESESQLQQPASAPAGHQHNSGQPQAQPQAQPSAPAGHEGHGSQSSVIINVEGKYSPDIVHAQVGRPLTLTFVRHDDSKCTEDVVLKDFNIRKKLDRKAPTPVTIVPSRKGEFLFSCGMDMVHGTIHVD